MTSPVTRDLFVLTADSQLQRTVETLLGYRRPSLGICDFAFDVRRHPRKDPGCRTEAAPYLREIQGEYVKAMVIFDLEGCGANNTTPEQLEEQLEGQIKIAGWGEDEIAAIVIEPELETWLFSASFQHLERVVSWSRSQPMGEWLASNGHLPSGSVKPADPKAAMDGLLEQARRPRTTKLYEEMAKTVGLARCQDRAFQKFRATLQRWFPAS